MAVTEREFGILIRRVESLEQSQDASSKIIHRLARDIYQGNGRESLAVTIANHAIRIRHLESGRSELRSSAVAFVTALATGLIGWVLVK